MLYQDSQSVLLVRKNKSLPLPLRDTPDSSFKQLAQGKQALIMGDLEAARTHLEKAREMMPWAGEPYGWLAILSAAEGDVQRGWQYIDEAEDIFPAKSYRLAYENYLKRKQR